MKKKLVIVYGNSLNMAGIAASLNADTSLDVVCIDAQTPNFRQSLDGLEPATILFDLTDPPSELDLGLLLDRPGLLLIGVDHSSDEVLVLSGQLRKVDSGRELAEIMIEDEAHPKAISRIRKIIKGGEIEQEKAGAARNT